MSVEITPLAERDLDQYLALIARDDPAAAVRVEARVVATLQILAEQPEIGREHQVRGVGRARVFAVRPLPLRAIYRDTVAGVLVLRIYHFARRPLTREL